MSDKKQKAKEQVEQIKRDSEKLRLELQDSDKDSQSRIEEIYDVIARHAIKIILVAISALGIASAVIADFTIPEWLYLACVGCFLSIVVLYPYVRMVANWLIDDDRKPVVEIDPENLFDLSVYLVPDNEIGSIEYVNGEPKEINTKKRGVGREVQKFEVVDTETGKDAYAEGTWASTKSGLELKKKTDNIQAMKEFLEPLAMLGWTYKMHKPYIIHSVSNDITNALVEDFQDVTSYKGGQMSKSIENVVEQFSPEKAKEAMTTSDTKYEETENSNGESTNGSDKLEDMDIEELAEIAGMDVERREN